MSRVARIVALVVILGAGAAGTAAWYSSRGEAAPAYRTAPAQRTDLVSTISATGTVVPEDVVDVGAQVNGQIAEFGTDTDGQPVDYRSTVNEGMLLARIDESIYRADVATSQAQLSQAQAAVTVAEARRDQAAARLEQTSRDWERAQRLGRSAALAEVDYDAAKAAYEQARASLALEEASIIQARASVAMAQASVERSQRNLTYCTIKSPVEGVIIDKRVEIGQTVVASLNAPSLFLIAKDLRRMQVLVQVNEADIGNVRPGQTATFTVDAHPGERFRGEVRKVRLNATMTQNVVTYTVEIMADNADLRLLPYLTANVRFQIARSNDVLAVPNAALRWSPPADAPPARSARAESEARPGGAPAPAAAEAGAGQAGGQRAPRSRSSGESGGPKQAGSTGTVWVLENGAPRPVAVRTGLSDGIMTEVQTDQIQEGAEVIIGDESPQARAGAPAPSGSSPFTPQIFRRGGGRGR